MSDFGNNSGSSYSALAIDGLSAATLDFTSTQKFDGSASFSIGVWVRPTAASAEGTLLSRAGAFNLSLVNGFPAFGFGNNGPVQAAWALTPNAWHHLWFSYAPAPSGTSPTMGISIDGAPADTVTGGATIEIQGAADTGGPLQIAPQNGIFTTAQLLAITLYSGTAEPEMTREYGWAAPTPQTPGLLAAFDFAGDTATDISANNYTVTLGSSATLQQYAPCAKFAAPQAYLQPDPADGLNPGDGANPFSLLISAVIEANEGGIVFANQAASGSSANGALALNILWQSATAVNAVLSYVPAGGAIVHRPITAALNSEIAVTYDGTTLTTYFDGNPVDTVTAGALEPIGEPNVALGGVAGQGVLTPQWLDGYIQRASIWNACLSAAEVAQFATSTAITDPRCLFYTELLYSEPNNLVTSRALLMTGNVVFTELVTPVAPAGNPAPRFAQWNARPVSQTPANGSSHAAIIDAINKLPSGSQPDAAHADLIASATRTFEPLLEGLSPAHQQQLRTAFADNLNNGMRLLASGNTIPGQVSLVSTADEHQIWYHDPVHGPTLVDSTPTGEISKYNAWIASIVLQCFIIVCDILLIGIIVSSAGKAIRQAIQAAPGLVDKIKAVTAVKVEAQTAVNVVKALYQAGQLGAVISASLAGVKWYQWVFTIASTLVSICALFLTGGAYVAVAATMAAFDIAKLVDIILHAPEEDQAQQGQSASALSAAE